MTSSSVVQCLPWRLEFDSELPKTMKHDYVTALGYLNLALEALVAIKGQLPAQ